MVQVSAAELLVHRDYILDVPGCVVTPGMVDMHVHVIGGGGEAGPSSCTPQSQLSNFLEAGITTVVGVLGTDCITRRQACLLPHTLEISHYSQEHRVLSLYPILPL